MGMVHCEFDWSVHSRSDDRGRTVTMMSVDDILVASDSKQESDHFAEELQSKYTVMYNGDTNWLLGCKIMHRQDQCCLKLDQECHVATILDVMI